jgi:hypothetical protein
MGDKYKFVPKEGPPPGLYDPNDSITKPRVPSVIIKEEVSPQRRPPEVLPDPGTYDGHLTPFGSGLKNVTMGDKYKFVPKEGPAPG